MRKNAKQNGIIVTAIIFIFALLFGRLAFHYNVKSLNVLIFQFGKVVDVKEDTGVYFTIPLIQSTKSIYVGERLYDIPTTSVTTSDKKSMICNAYVTWRVVYAKTYYQKLSSVETAKGRIDTAVYSAMKNVISSNTQDDVISGKDGSLCLTIRNKIKSLASYGIEVTNLEIKVLDLPDENKASVYERMISERSVIAAEYTANGEKEANTIKSQTDSTVRQTKSDAEAEAASIIADGETQYYQILADAYSKSEERRAFYKYWTELEALKNSLNNGGTIVIDENNPLYTILINNANTLSNSN